MDRHNHYETAFEGFLQHNKLCYVGVDETRRSFLGDERVKNPDFIVHGANDLQWIVDVKGRRYGSGQPERPRRCWESWCKREDIDSLRLWASRFGPSYRPLLVFLYELTSPSFSVWGDRWAWRDRQYLLRAVDVNRYRTAMRLRSPKWGTVNLTRKDYRRLARPFSEFVGGGGSSCSPPEDFYPAIEFHHTEGASKSTWFRPTVIYEPHVVCRS